MPLRCRCPNCGKKYVGWALKYEMEQAGFVKCEECGTKITEISEDLVSEKIENKENNIYAFSLDWRELWHGVKG